MNITEQLYKDITNLFTEEELTPIQSTLKKARGYIDATKGVTLND